MTCFDSFLRKRVSIMSARELFPHLVPRQQRRSRSSRSLFSVLTASRTGLTGSTGLSDHSIFGASMSVGLQRPPRWMRYFSSQNASARHSAAERSHRLRGLMSTYLDVQQARTYSAKPCSAIFAREQSPASFL